LLTPEGGKAYLKRIRKLCQNVLPWDRQRWKKEINTYLEHWLYAHALPVRRAEALEKGKIFSLQALGSALRSIYYKIGPKRRRDQIL